MRITNSMLTSNMTYNLNNSMRRQELLQYQTSTGKKFRIPSDDPIGASKSLKFNTDLSKLEQYKRNAEDAQSWMKETEMALTEINNILHRANHLTVQASTQTNSPDDLKKIKAEISELKGHLIQIGNTTYAGRSIFTGYKTDKNLLKEDGTYNVSLPEIVGGAAQEERVTYNVGVAEVTEVNTLGNAVFGSGDGDYKLAVKGKKSKVEGEKAYLVKLFDDLENDLENPTAEELDEYITHIQKARDNILSVTAEVGAKSNRLKLTSEKLKDQALNMEDLLSKNEDVGLPEAYMKLTMEENVYNASLAVSGRIIQPSLIDFLR